MKRFRTKCASIQSIPFDLYYLSFKATEDYREKSLVRIESISEETVVDVRSSVVYSREKLFFEQVEMCVLTKRETKMVLFCVFSRTGDKDKVEVDKNSKKEVRGKNLLPYWLDRLSQ